MKYGVLLNLNTKNFGDDIQAYAQSRFYPHVDYMIDRETIDTFKSENNEPVATITSAWYMWKKWNWPPADCIVPKILGMHVNNYSSKEKGSPITNEWISGIGKQWFNDNGPVGARDYQTLDLFKNNGIDSYFSGCITLTLPKQKKIKPEKDYICFVDLNPKIEKKMREILKEQDIEIKVISHNMKKYKEGTSWEQREKEVERILTIYQNAKCVVTRRLHGSLPCLAMGVPVFCIASTSKNTEVIRFSPYKDWLHFANQKDFFAGNYDFDFMNPPKNKDTYKKTRNELIKTCTDFIKNCEKGKEKQVINYTEEEKLKWQNEMMVKAYGIWYCDHLEEREEIQNSVKEYLNCKKKKHLEKINLNTEEEKLSYNNIKLKKALINNQKISYKLMEDKKEIKKLVKEYKKSKGLGQIKISFKIFKFRLRRKINKKLGR